MKQETQITAALGMFDGVHLGHRRVLQEAAALGTCNVVTFASETMPEKQGHLLKYIYHDEQKRRLLTACGADAVFALPFGEFQNLDGEAFCKQILRDQLHVAHVVCGEDFRFGRRAQSTADDLVRIGQRLGFQVTLVPCIHDAKGLPVSSSHIRFLLESGQLTLANQLLGADYQILCHVVTGQQLGAKLFGVPTANQTFESWQCIPRRGVYASFAEINDIWVPAITNIGVRPTVAGADSEPVAETHLLGFNGDLVGTLLPVTLCKFMRPEKRFDSVEALTVQMQRDIQARKKLLTD
ncbi:MAG: riboflavin biosynthesis protein RibF [Oscillospiraceae bacterium]|nr:riboflavin biosynthesis protein RibF [Oscillospiraceae bacterium]